MFFSKETIRLGRTFFRMHIARLNRQIPKKGRIRLLLAVLAFLGLFKAFSGSSVKPTSDTPADLRAPSCVNSALPFRKFRYLSRDDIGTLLKSCPPSWQSAQDTLKFRDKSMVVHYTLDPELQAWGKRIFEQYHPRCGALVAIDPATGRLLALVSYENRPDASDSTLFLRAFCPAASTFKIITAAAAMESSGLHPDSRIVFAGNRYTLYRFQLKEELRSSTQTSLSEAFAYSINPVFGRVGIYYVGGKKLSDYAARFGYGAEIPFELPTEVSTIKVCDSNYQVAELASGFNEETRLTPLLGALITASLVEDGRMYRPFLVDERIHEDPLRRRAVRGMMGKVVQFGTARKSFRHVLRSFDDETELGGKTGSLSEDGLGKIDWFVGFGRHKSDPRQRIAVSVVAVFGPYWTVHSSYIGAEMVRRHCRGIQIADREKSRAELSQNQPPTDDLLF